MCRHVEKESFLWVFLRLNSLIFRNCLLPAQFPESEDLFVVLTL